MAPSSRQKPSTASASEADVVTNRALLQYSEASRLARSWLSDFTSSTGQDDHETEQEEEAERELLKKHDLFSDTGGVGYRAPEFANGSTSRPAATDPTTAFLRRQLLSGRNTGTHNGLKGHNATVTRPRHQAQQSVKLGRDSDEDESRATVGKRRVRDVRRNTVGATSVVRTQRAAPDEDTATNTPPKSEMTEQNNDNSAPAQRSTAMSSSDRPKKRGTSSYLDELLASRAAKKQKKKQSKSNTG